MICPLCAHALTQVERQGIELDHCTSCGGFWLDQGELDKLVQGEAMTALMQGQRALTEARHEREYDQNADYQDNFGETPQREYVLPARSENRFSLSRGEREVRRLIGSR